MLPHGASRTPQNPALNVTTSTVSDDGTSERIPVSRDLAAATIYPHRLAAFACAVVRHAGGAPGWSYNLAALDPVDLRSNAAFGDSRLSHRWRRE